tara:strand:+ start:161 stop:502 length:342 start_codon:yes stop_codon:yes gene_type:complete
MMSKFFIALVVLCIFNSVEVHGMIDKHGHHKDFHNDDKQWKSVKHLHTHTTDKERVSEHARAIHEKKKPPGLRDRDKLGVDDKRSLEKEATQVHSAPVQQQPAETGTKPPAEL